MDETNLRGRLLAILKTIAPELEPEALRADRPLREEVDLDSMDWLRFMAAIERELGRSIPEADYGRLASLDALCAYLASPAGGTLTPPGSS